MIDLLNNLVVYSANAFPDHIAVRHKADELTYEHLATEIEHAACGFKTMGLERDERIAIYLPKRPETVTSFFAAGRANGVFVPINPLLKPAQVEYILRDCNVRMLVTSKDRYLHIREALDGCHDLHTIVLVDEETDQQPKSHKLNMVSWQQLLSASDVPPVQQRIDTDMAAIFYTSGSTGKPKGVVLSHRNMVLGAKSVAAYLNNTQDDRLLAVLPLSFDYGFSQLSTALYKGASVTLMDYLLPRDVLKTIAKDGITGLAGVPPLWNQLKHLEWPAEAAQSIRYITNSGGAMPKTTLNHLRNALPNSQVYLMYGLTEAFRSTYLPPGELDKRPDSMGKAIPNAEVMVVREDGTPCRPGEPGELIHKGSLVAMGYWNSPDTTAERFKPAPGQDNALTIPEVSVWSGDTVKTDADGFLYFVGRKDDMIKTSGYRVSSTEVEEVVYATQQVGEVVALGIPHPTLEQGILIVATPNPMGHHDNKIDEKSILTHCKKELPNFMVPLAIKTHDALPRNPNGKIDRKLLSSMYQDIFS
ncbi:acyl-CoA ligase (AMP-forming), exosortase A system-associated [Pseudomonadota bacterium]